MSGQLSIHVVTLVLNGMPFLPVQYDTFKRYTGNLTWILCHGQAANTGSTRWCKVVPGALSSDGTTELLESWKKEMWIRIYEKPFWEGGKDQMFRTALEGVMRPTLLLQVDHDEMWKTEQLYEMVRMFQELPGRTHALFWCRYYFGPRIIMTSRNCYAQNPNQEWRRLWLLTDNMQFKSHEPPEFTNEGKAITHAETEARGLVFDHAGYMLRKQVEFKQRFYGYENAVDQWEALQRNTQWPVRLNKFLKWVPANDTAEVDLIK